MTTPRRRATRIVAGAFTAAIAVGSAVVGVPGSTPIASATGALQTISLETPGSGEVALGTLASRSQRGDVSISGIGPYTVSGTDSLSAQPYSFQTDVNYSGPNAYTRESEIRSGNSISTSFDDNASFSGRDGVLRLSSGGNCPSDNTAGGPGEAYCSSFGPEVYSDAFDADAGNVVTFDWGAVRVSDDYEIYAYLVEVTETSPGVYDYGSPASTTLLTYGRGRNQPWITASGQVPSTSTYRFRFVNGTYDATGGFAIGSTMYIDNVIRVGLANDITFNQPADTPGASNVELTATATSPGGGPVTFTSIDTSVCTVSGTTVTTITPGVCAIIADHPGDGVDYVPAASVTRSFNVTPVAPTWTDDEIGSITFDEAFTDAVAATGSPPPTYSVTAGTLPAGLSLSSGTGALTGTPTVVGDYDFTITASNGTAPAVTQRFTGTIIAEAPAWTDDTISKITFDVAYSDGVKASGNPTPTYSVTVGSLPAGLTLDTNTGAITGTPTASGEYDFTISASNGVDPDIDQRFPGAVAPAEDPDADVEPPSTDGGTVTVTGKNFKPGSTVQIVVDGTVVGTTTADSEGNVSADVTPPEGEKDYDIKLSGTSLDDRTIETGKRLVTDLSGTTNVVPDEQGYLPITPTRVLDTRSGDRVDAGAAQRITIDSSWNVPASATAVAINVAAVQGTGVGFLTIHGCDSDRPLASSVNFQPSTNKANLVIVEVDDSDEVCIYASESVHLVVDVNGYFSPDLVDRVGPATPVRLLDTRDGAKLGAGDMVEVQVTGDGLAPAGAVAAVLNIAAPQANSLGFLTVYDCSEDRPLASNVNYDAGRTTANLVFAELSDDGRACIYTSQPTHLVVDLNGAFESSETPVLVAHTPSRFLDTRDGARVGAGEIVRLELGESGLENVAAYALNLTSARSTDDGYATVFACDEDRPSASSINFGGGVQVANHVTAKAGADGVVCIYVSAPTHLVVDVTGVYL